MSAQKFHIGKNGPAPCHAKVRACEFDVNGTQQEVNQVWEKEQEALFADTMLSGVSKSAKSDATIKPEDEANVENPSKAHATKTLSDRDNYIPSAAKAVYSDSDKDIAMKLALSNLSELSYTPIEKQDNDWMSKGFSHVDRYILKDGSVGYFKSLRKNSHMEESFREYATTSIGAAINEVNAYRMAKAFGGKYAELVPETVIREINGSIGTLQREVDEIDRIDINYDKTPELKEDFRRAAIFDFVIGNLDRHSANYLYGVEEGSGRPCIRLIDNSFSFPDGEASVNMSVFADNEGNYTMPENELTITEEEVTSLNKVRGTVAEWVLSDTIDTDLGVGTIERIDFLLEERQIGDFSDFYYEYSINRPI